MNNATMIITSRHDATEQRGASLVEYALLVLLISLVSVSAMKVAGNSIFCTFNSAATQLTEGEPAPAPGIPSSAVEAAGCE